MRRINLLMSGRPHPSTLRLLGLVSLALLVSCEPTAPPPTSSPLSGNQVNGASGAACTIPDPTIQIVPPSDGTINFIDGQCLQPFTSLTYQAPIANPTPAECQVSY